MPSEDKEAILERERVKYVFGLTGGELHDPHPDFPDPWDKLFDFWYEGMPQWAGTPDPTAICHDPEFEFRTAIIEDNRDPKPELEIWSEGVIGPIRDRWELYEWFRSSGEVSCPFDGAEADRDLRLARLVRIRLREDGVDQIQDEVNRCTLCEDDGVIYIGDIWFEAVYFRRFSP